MVYFMGEIDNAEFGLGLIETTLLGSAGAYVGAKLYERKLKNRPFYKRYKFQPFRKRGKTDLKFFPDRK